jgi:hypothetical protein
MGTNYFMDKSVKPEDKTLKKALGDTSKYWIDIKSYIAENYPGTAEEWKKYGEKYGWTLKTLLKKRNLFFFAAYDGYFNITFIFGDKAVAIVEKSDLPKSIIEKLCNSKKYMEGRGINIEVKKQKDVGIIKKLIDIKVNN